MLQKAIDTKTKEAEYPSLFAATGNLYAVFYDYDTRQPLFEYIRPQPLSLFRPQDSIIYKFAEKFWVVVETKIPPLPVGVEFGRQDVYLLEIKFAKEPKT